MVTSRSENPIRLEAEFTPCLGEGERMGMVTELRCSPGCPVHTLYSRMNKPIDHPDGVRREGRILARKDEAELGDETPGSIRIKCKGTSFRETFKVEPKVPGSLVVTWKQ